MVYQFWLNPPFLNRDDKIMATRPVFIPKYDGSVLVDIQETHFQWHSGMSLSQKQKSIFSLHQSYLSKNPNGKILEISTKSTIDLGRDLSAFNLCFQNKKGLEIPVENIFQSSKKFTHGGPFNDILYKTPRDAKRDERLKNSGNLIGFLYKEDFWDLEPKTAFYDWLYINILNLKQEINSRLFEYTAFTDIEFNPKKSINCQAYSVALFLSLKKRKLIKPDEVINKESFLSIVKEYDYLNTSSGSLI